jgi:hypothetical protein
MRDADLPGNPAERHSSSSGPCAGSMQPSIRRCQSSRSLSPETLSAANMSHRLVLSLCQQHLPAIAPLMHPRGRCIANAIDNQVRAHPRYCEGEGAPPRAPPAPDPCGEGKHPGAGRLRPHHPRISLAAPGAPSEGTTLRLPHPQLQRQTRHERRRRRERPNGTDGRRTPTRVSAARPHPHGRASLVTSRGRGHRGHRARRRAACRERPPQTVQARAQLGVERVALTSLPPKRARPHEERWR